MAVSVSLAFFAVAEGRESLERFFAGGLMVNQVIGPHASKRILVSRGKIEASEPSAG
jgi:hypothetical protein